MVEEWTDWLRFSRTRGIGTITFFHLLERYGSAAAMLEDLPSLAGLKTAIKAPESSDRQRESDATAKLRTTHLAACEPDRSACLAARSSRTRRRRDRRLAARRAPSSRSHPLRVEEIVRATDASHHLVLTALAELELADQAVTHGGGTSSRAV